MTKALATMTICAFGCILAFAWASSIWAQCPGDVTAAFQVLDPALSVVELHGTDLLDPNPCDNQRPPRYECGPHDLLRQTLLIGADATGNQYYVAVPQAGSLVTEFDSEHYGLLLQRQSPDGTVRDLIRLFSTVIINSGASFWEWRYQTPFMLDVVNGTISIALKSVPYFNLGCPQRVAVAQIRGLPQMFDTLLTFIPGGQLAALIPAHPDGFRSAGWMQAWTGDVGSMPDWSQAQPLTCDAATNPLPGQVVTIADTLPDPALGHGRYYLTASVNGTDRRLGRQYVNGGFSARDPASLSVCAP